MKSNNVFFVLIACLIVSCTPKKESKKAVVKSPYFGVVPTKQPQLLAPELIASPTEEYNGTFSPDGSEFYYTTDIPENAFITFTKLLPDNTWSEPKIASFSGVYSDFDPLFSPDGSRLYFSSSRPLPDNMNSKIWYVERNESGWSEPQAVILTGSEQNEYYSSITENGDIYFNIWSTGKIFKGVKTDTSYVVNELPPVINSKERKGDPFIAPNEEYLIFRGYEEDSFGRGDLYISFNIDSNWTEPENLGEPINSSAHEMCPYVTTNGELFIFSSDRIHNKIETAPLSSIKPIQDKFRSKDNGEQNIYYMSASFIDKMKQKHLKPKE